MLAVGAATAHRRRALLAAAAAAVAGGVLPAAARAQDPAFPDFPREVAGPGGRRLALNGVGARRFFGFEVYRAALYLPAVPARDAAAVLALPGPKVLRVLYTRDAPERSIVSGWEESFARGECRCAMPAALRARLRAVRAGEVETYVFFPGHAEVAYGDERPTRVEGADAARRMLLAFIGPEAQSEGLRRGLLGHGNG